MSFNDIGIINSNITLQHFSNAYLSKNYFPGMHGSNVEFGNLSSGNHAFGGKVFFCNFDLRENLLFRGL